MSDGSIISISSNDDDDDDDRDGSDTSYSPPQGDNSVPCLPPFPKNTHQKSISLFLKKKKGSKRFFHNPNAARTRRGNDVGKKGDNDKGSGAWGGDKLVVYALKLGKKGGTFEWEATVTRRLNADLIVCAQRVNMKEW